MLVLYAIVPSGWRAPASSAPLCDLSTVTSGPVTVLYAERSEAPGTSQEEVLAFGRVVSAIAEKGPVLPIRFGTMVESVEDLRPLLADRAQQWHEQIEHVRGHVEMLVHVSDPAAPETVTAGAGSGREYLLSRAAVHRHGAQIAACLASAVAPYCREVRRLEGSQTMRLACLVPAGAVEDFREALDRWAASGSARSIRCTGPWPTFSFTEQETR